jgi:hypothetical protein
MFKTARLDAMLPISTFVIRVRSPSCCKPLLDAMVTRENPGVADSFSNLFRVFPSLKGKYFGVRMNPGSEAHHDIGKKKGLANYANRKGRRVC